MFAKKKSANGGGMRMRYNFKDLESKSVGELEAIKQDKQSEYHRAIQRKHTLIANILSLQGMVELESQAGAGVDLPSGP
jgi:hypothetical protein